LLIICRDELEDIFDDTNGRRRAQLMARARLCH
jgi:hypothetical protein